MYGLHVFVNHTVHPKFTPGITWGSNSRDMADEGEKEKSRKRRTDLKSALRSGLSGKRRRTLENKDGRRDQSAASVALTSIIGGKGDYKETFTQCHHLYQGTITTVGVVVELMDGVFNEARHHLAA